MLTPLILTFIMLLLLTLEIKKYGILVAFNGTICMKNFIK